MLRTLNAVLILWNDSNVGHGWISEGALEFEEVAHCRTVGILKFEDEEKIVVVLSDSDCGSVLEPITIPKSCITTIRKLRVR